MTHPLFDPHLDAPPYRPRVVALAGHPLLFAERRPRWDGRGAERRRGWWGRVWAWVGAVVEGVILSDWEGYEGE